MSASTSQMLYGLNEVLKDRIRGLLGKREEKDPSELTEAERWVQSEIAYQKRNKGLLASHCFGLHYSEWYLRSLPAEEVYAKWQADVERLEQYIDDLVEQNKKKAEAEKRAEEKRAAEKGMTRKEKKKRKEKKLADIIEFRRKTDE